MGTKLILRSSRSRATRDLTTLAEEELPDLTLSPLLTADEQRELTTRIESQRREIVRNLIEFDSVWQWTVESFSRVFSGGLVVEKPLKKSQSRTSTVRSSPNQRLNSAFTNGGWSNSRPSNPN
jgi:hypothetical protein